MGITEVLGAPRSPWQRAYVERIIGSIRARLSRSRDRVGRIIPPSNSSFLLRLLPPFENPPFARQRCSGTPPGAASRKNCRHSPGRWTSPPVRTTSRSSGAPLPLSSWFQRAFQLVLSRPYLFCSKTGIFHWPCWSCDHQPKAAWPEAHRGSNLNPCSEARGSFW